LPQRLPRPNRHRRRRPKRRRCQFNPSQPPVRGPK
jgi:hypothetical protein